MKQSLLTLLRDKKTPLKEFRKAADQLFTLIASDLEGIVKEEETLIETPIHKTSGCVPSETVILIPILRSGIALMRPFLGVFEEAKVGVLGIKREEKTAIPHLYYQNLPSLTPHDKIILLDPMLATGGTALLAIDSLIKVGASPSKIHFVGLIATTDAIQKIVKKYPQITLHIEAPNESLSPDFWITPGLGDFGDRYFGTEKK